GSGGRAEAGVGRGGGGRLRDQKMEVRVRGIKDRWQRPEVVADYQVPAYAATPASLGNAAGVDRGRAVFAAACAGCHGQDGRGSPKGGAGGEPSYLARVSDQHLRTTVIAGRSDLGMPAWRLDG